MSKPQKWTMIKKRFWYEVRDSQGSVVSQGGSVSGVVRAALAVAVQRNVAVEIVGEPVEGNSTGRNDSETPNS